MTEEYVPVRGKWMAVVCVVLLGSGLDAGAVEVTLAVREGAGVGRQPGVVTAGVPFAKGAVADVGALSVSVGGKPIPAQFIEIAPWDDGSVRWALMDCQADVPAGGMAELVVRDDGKNPGPATPVRVTEAGSSIRVSTGPLEFTVDKRKFNLFRSLKVDGRELVTSAGRGLVIYSQDGGAVPAGAPSQVTIEQAGPMKAIVCVKGKYPGLHEGLIGYTVRITAYAGRKLLKVHAWLENGGAHGYAPRDGNWKPEWFCFDGMAVELGLGLGGPLTAECEGARAAGPLKVLQLHNPPEEYAGPGWTMDDFEYTIAGASEEPIVGKRTDGVTTVSGSNGTVTAAVRNFWQNYEKAIELRDDDTLKVWLWPLEGEYPRNWDLSGQHVVPGYAKDMMHPLRKDGFYNMPGAVHKGHELVLDFSGRDPRQTHAELASPLFALAPAAYYASTGAAPGMFAPPEVRTGDGECDAKLDAWMRMTRSVADRQDPSSIWAARSSGGRNLFWYGWMDFGDLAVPGSGSVSLHYDWPWVLLAGAMRTGDPRFVQFAVEMTRHRIDVDQQWSDRERAEYRGFQRGDFTFPHFHCARFTRHQPDVADNWLAGVVLYYMLTGEPKARECIERNSQALLDGWKRMAANADDWYVGRKLGDVQMAARSIFAYTAMYDLTADAKWLEEALGLFRSYVIPKWEAHGPHLHARDQIRSQDYIRDDVKYCYSIQALCELHRHTGDEKLFELLRAGCDREFPENFFDAPLFLADLCAYVGLRTGDEGYLDDAIEYWIQGFPESKSPPVYLPDNSQWSRRKAMMLRTGHLLQYAHWKLSREK